jgi:hypothetical protein
MVRSSLEKVILHETRNGFVWIQEYV